MRPSASTSPPATERGHRVLPHTADAIVEAWGPTKAACLEEAVRGLVDLFATARGPGPEGDWPVAIGPAPDDELLVSLLDEVLTAVDVTGAVPVAASLEADGDGVRGVLKTVPADAVEVHGAVPKAIAWSGLEFGRRDGGWRCRFTVDV
jgi:SHS2 domain-containing protein